MTDNTLISKIAKAALDVGGKLEADKTNKDQNYDYLSADKILGTCGQALFNQGVAVVPDIEAQETTLLEYTDQYGKAKKRYDNRTSFIFHVTDGTTTLDLHWWGVGSDYAVPDKALYKAITSGHKYFLMKLLCVGVGNEDGEHEESEKKPTRQVDKATGEIKRPEPAKHPATPAQPEQADKHEVFDVPDPLKDKWPLMPKISYATASTLAEKNGHRYVDITLDKLPYVRKALQERLEKNGMTEAAQEVTQMKLDTLDIVESILKPQ
jgi:hypothetical protein